MTKERLQADLISNNIKKLRESLGWNQSKLATTAKISGAALSVIEKGEGRIPTMIVLQKLADALKVPVSEITGEETQDRSEQDVKYTEFFRKFGEIANLPKSDQEIFEKMLERLTELSKKGE
tara:strand:- start:3127 stop:3492 length:366 start_codon:yes stop_codon:yes gene_type:complete